VTRHAAIPFIFRFSAIPRPTFLIHDEYQPREHTYSEHLLFLSTT
jgi:hypothetical protein